MQDFGDCNVRTSAESFSLSDEYILASVLAGQQYYQTLRTKSLRFRYDW